MSGARKTLAANLIGFKAFLLAILIYVRRQIGVLSSIIPQFPPTHTQWPPIFSVHNRFNFCYLHCRQSHRYPSFQAQPCSPMILGKGFHSIIGNASYPTNGCCSSPCTRKFCNNFWIQNSAALSRPLFPIACYSHLIRVVWPFP
jgi:hypothetical protein